MTHIERPPWTCLIGRSELLSLYESIAQLVERLPYKQDVGGSSPSILTIGVR